MIAIELWWTNQELSIAFHHGSPCSYVTWGTKSRPVGGPQFRDVVSLHRYRDHVNPFRCEVDSESQLTCCYRSFPSKSWKVTHAIGYIHLHFSRESHKHTSIVNSIVKLTRTGCWFEIAFLLRIFFILLSIWLLDDPTYKIYTWRDINQKLRQFTSWVNMPLKNIF
jgi:hypothetical protein